MGNYLGVVINMHETTSPYVYFFMVKAVGQKENAKVKLEIGKTGNYFYF